MCVSELLLLLTTVHPYFSLIFSQILRLDVDQPPPTSSPGSSTTSPAKSGGAASDRARLDLDAERECWGAFLRLNQAAVAQHAPPVAGAASSVHGARAAGKLLLLDAGSDKVVMYSPTPPPLASGRSTAPAAAIDVPSPSLLPQPPHLLQTSPTKTSAPAPAAVPISTADESAEAADELANLPGADKAFAGFEALSLLAESAPKKTSLPSSNAHSDGSSTGPSLLEVQNTDKEVPQPPPPLEFPPPENCAVMQAVRRHAEASRFTPLVVVCCAGSADAKAHFDASLVEDKRGAQSYASFAAKVLEEAARELEAR